MSEREAFPSLGIGHFIWYPSGVQEPFVESFPSLVQYLIQRQAPVPDWLTVDWLLSQFARRRAEARRRYRQFVSEGGPSVWSELRQQIYLGDETFVEQIAATVGGFKEMTDCAKERR